MEFLTHFFMYGLAQLLFLYVPIPEKLGSSNFLEAQRLDVKKDTIYIYSGPGAELGCIIGAAVGLKQALCDAYRFAFIGPKGIKAGLWKKNAALIVMPGGADLPYLRELTPDGNEAIRSYVGEGGRYLGFCAGAYYAAAAIIFAPRTDLEVVGPRPLDFFNGTVYGPILAPYDYKSDSGARLAAIAWKNPKKGQEQILHAYYNGGGTFLDAHRFKNTTVVGIYKNRLLNLPKEDQELLPLTQALQKESQNDSLSAALLIRYKNGLALLSGIHPELPPELIELSNYYRRDPTIAEILPNLKYSNSERFYMLQCMCHLLGLSIR